MHLHLPSVEVDVVPSGTVPIRFLSFLPVPPLGGKMIATRLFGRMARVRTRGMIY